MEKQRKIGLQFSEKMSGYFAEGEEDFEEGYKRGKEQNNTLLFEVTILIDSVSDFTKLSGHRARLEGTVSSKRFGEKISIRNGEFTLFQPSEMTGKREMIYSFSFTGVDDTDYFLHGHKVLHDDPGGVDVFDDMTTLFTKVYRGEERRGEGAMGRVSVSPRLRVSASPFGAGILRFEIPDLPSMLASFKVTNTDSLSEKIKAKSEFYSFCYGELRDTYLHTLSPIYYTEYENLVLNGKVATLLVRNRDGSWAKFLKDEEPQDFFFFSGIHDKDFPWGDDGVFWDIALLLRNSDGSWARFLLTDRIIENLKLDVGKGIYQYEGEIYQIVKGYQASFSQLKKSPLPDHLRKLHAKIDIQFRAKAFETVDMPFSLISNFKEHIPSQLMANIEELSNQLDTLGLHLGPHRVIVTEGKITLSDQDTSHTYIIQKDKTLGEAEKSTFNNIKEPTLYYNYFCFLNPESDHIYVQIRSGALRENRKNYLVDKIEAHLGKIINQIASLDLQIQKGISKALPRSAQASPSDFPMVDENLLEINNDHFPTGVFQRRIISAGNAPDHLIPSFSSKSATRQVFYALEEDMDTLNLSSINSDKVEVVAAIKDPDKFKALDAVLESTGFFQKVDAACERSRKSKESFSIVVKPNFMFMYSKKDISTFTDPTLVEYLVNRIYERGYRNLAVAEARSTYGMFFTNREVKTIAEHIGLSGKNYRIIDLSEDLIPYRYSGKLGDHYVNREWKDADFRISFAKNKTHSYVYYTLTIKNIYGALPSENKFLEYHNKRDIHTTTIEYIKHFPIHFGLIDASVSADGPFGIFADKEPNHTEAIIGGGDIVAVDWIGAAKMGLDPMESDYMEEAVKELGKPEIEFIGDREIYPNWVNVTDVVPQLAFGLDRSYYFGNLFYSVFSYMDPFFQYKSKSLSRKFLRVLADPMKGLFFQRVEDGLLDADLNRRLYELYDKAMSSSDSAFKTLRGFLGGRLLGFARRTYNRVRRK